MLFVSVSLGNWVGVLNGGFPSVLLKFNWPIISEEMVSVYCLLKYLFKNELTKQLSVKSYFLKNIFLPQNNLMTFEEPQVLIRNAEILQEMRTNAFTFAPIFLIPSILRAGLSDLFPKSETVNDDTSDNVNI